MKLRVVAALAVLAVYPCSAQFPVWDGGRQAVVVHEANPVKETVQAYEDLASYLERATGRKFIVVSEEEFSGEGWPIYVGRCRALSGADRQELEGIDRDAFLVHATSEAVFLAGPRPWSTYWAVCQFLEDQVGVRWLIPGELGEDVPHSERIMVPIGRQIHAPVLLSRLWSGAQHGGVWNLRQRIHGRYRFHHNLLRVFDPARHFDEHPEWYPLRAGKRYRPGKEDHSWQPCMATESGVQHAADVARAAWAENPDLESYSYGGNDGQGWCTCDVCVGMDREIEAWEGFEGTYSHRYFGWLNKIAAELEKTDPDKLIGCLAYSSYILPPDQLDLHRNIIPYLTSNRADYFDAEFREQDQQLLELWGRAAGQLGIYDYAYGMGFAIPRIYSHLFQEAILHAVQNSVKGFYAEVYPNWGLDGPKLYIMARVLWNPQVDIDGLSDEWNERMFREAAEPMKRYFARCEEAWREQQTGRGHWAYRLAADPKQFQIFPPEVLDECTVYLDEAAALAEDELVKQRIHFFRKTWDVTLLLAGQYGAAREVQELIDASAPLEQVAAALRRLAAKIATTDIDAYIADKVGDDPVAFYPPKQSWIAPLKGGAETSAKRWSAAHIAGEAVAQAKTDVLDAEELRGQIGDRVDETFGVGGSETYLQIVGQIRAMARKVATVVMVKSAPVLDGALDDPVWRRADELSGFSKWGELALSGYDTRAWLAHDGENLYVALDCRQDTVGLRTEAAPRDGSTWKDDSVELFFNPQMSEIPYVQFIVNARGAFFDQWGRNERQTYQERLSADFDCEWATQVGAEGWTAELRLPLAEFGCSPEQNRLLRIDLVRNVQGKEAEISAWFPSVGAHADPLSRGWIAFE